MSEARFALVPVMDHEIHVTEWGRPGNPAIIMMHGLARTGRDFDEIASALSGRYHVLCPDMIGRGRSSWSADPASEYRIEYYAGIASDLLDHYALDRVSWLGTSMGGQIGMRLASSGHAGRLACLIINDVGPEVPQTAIERILSYVGNLPGFDGFAQAETWLRSAYATFGPACDAYWQRMARTSLRRRDDGGLTLHYDPRIVQQLNYAAEELTTWDRWARTETPSHVFAGAHSDLLTAPILERMLATGPQPRCTLLADCGHAPTLSRPGDIVQVRAALDALTAGH